MQNEIAYSRPVTLTNILKFAVPTIAMSVFMSFYTMVDGLFVSNLIGTSALSALNLVYPVIALVTAISTMLATGGSAAIMRKMGEGKPDEAKQDFTFLILVNVLTGLVMCGLGYLFMGKIFGSMSLSPEVSAYCWEYLSRYLLFTVPILLMNNFTLYMIAAGKASLSLLCSVAGGVTNIVLDYLFIAVFRWGIGGAAVATGLGYSITAIVGLLVFSNRNSLLHFVRPVCRPQTLGRAVTNGCSEMATALVNGIITLMFNWTMLKYVGEDGVAAITIISYVLAFAGSLYAGYAYGVAPMLSFYYGEQNHEKLRKLVRTSLKIIGAIAAATVLVSLAVTEPLVSIFARPGTPGCGRKPDLFPGPALCGLQHFCKRDVHRTFQWAHFGSAGVFPHLCLYTDRHAGPPGHSGRHRDLAGDTGRGAGGSRPVRRHAPEIPAALLLLIPGGEYFEAGDFAGRNRRKMASVPVERPGPGFPALLAEREAVQG